MVSVTDTTVVSVTDTAPGGQAGCHRGRRLIRVANFDTDVRDLIMYRLQELLD